MLKTIQIINVSTSFLHLSTEKLHLLSELFLCGRRGTLWSSPPDGMGGIGGGPGRPGGIGGGPPGNCRDAGEDEDDEGLELKEGGGGGVSRFTGGR